MGLGTESSHCHQGALHSPYVFPYAVIVSALRDDVAMVEQGLAEVGTGVILLDAEDRPRLTTPLAHRWLTEFFGVRAAGRSLPDTIARWVARNTLPSRDDLPEPRTPLVVEGETSCLVARLVSHNSPHLLVLQKQPRGGATMWPGELGLSGREAEIMTWVAQGRTSLETAAILELSRRTVEKHLEHIYRKLGVENAYGGRRARADRRLRRGGPMAAESQSGSHQRCSAIGLHAQ
jgi:DNA-binding CsgD family transcriptional regulator